MRNSGNLLDVQNLKGSFIWLLGQLKHFPGLWKLNFEHFCWFWFIPHFQSDLFWSNWDQDGHASFWCRMLCDFEDHNVCGPTPKFSSWGSNCRNMAANEVGQVSVFVSNLDLLVLHVLWFLTNSTEFFLDFPLQLSRISQDYVFPSSKLASFRFSLLFDQPEGRPYGDKSSVECYFSWYFLQKNQASTRQHIDVKSKLRKSCKQLLHFRVESLARSEKYPQNVLFCCFLTSSEWLPFPIWHILILNVANVLCNTLILLVHVEATAPAPTNCMKFLQIAIILTQEIFAKILHSSSSLSSFWLIERMNLASVDLEIWN